MERDIEDKKNPLGSTDEQCFQVESSLVFEEKDVNGKLVKKILYNITYMILEVTMHVKMMNSMMTDWKVEEALNNIVLGKFYNNNNNYIN